jgi:hypothetical protein
LLADVDKLDNPRGPHSNSSQRRAKRPGCKAPATLGSAVPGWKQNLQTLVEAGGGQLGEGGQEAGSGGRSPMLTLKASDG